MTTPILLSKKRYIAGAVCHSCRVIDKAYVVYEAQGAEETPQLSRHCNRCGYSETLSGEINLITASRKNAS